MPAGAMKPGFGDRLKQAREAAGLQQDELAGQSGIDQGNLSRMERGLRGPPRGDKILKLGELLNVAPRWLTDGDGTGPGTKATSVDLDDRYASRRRVVRWARDAGTSEAVLEELESEKHSSANDPGADYWQARLETLIAEHRRMSTRTRDALAGVALDPGDEAPKVIPTAKSKSPTKLKR